MLQAQLLRQQQCRAELEAQMALSAQAAAAEAAAKLEEHGAVMTEVRCSVGCQCASVGM